MDILLENAMLTMIYNQVNNGKKVCHYNCGEKLVKDANRDLKLRVCKANCDVQWDQQYIKKIQELIQQNPNDLDLRNNSKPKMEFAQKRLKQSQLRLVKAKQALQAFLTKAPADMSNRPARPTPPAQQGY